MHFSAEVSVAAFGGARLMAARARG